VVKRSTMESLILKEKSLKGFTFAIRFYYIRQKFLSNDKIELILSKVPHKKNGTLHKKRTTCILKLNCVDEDAMMCMIYAKNLDDMALEINVKQFYVGDDISQDNELSVEIL
jgi:hypothetical protein